MNVLEACGVTGYAVLRNVLGKGDKKVESFDPITGEVENLMIVTTIDEDSLNPLIESLRPLLKRFGGLIMRLQAKEVLGLIRPFRSFPAITRSFISSIKRGVFGSKSH